MRVAVVGAGATGVCAVKACLEEGLDVVCFEQRTSAGGLWNYSEDPAYTTVMKTTVMNTSKEMSTFSDFPFPRTAPPFVPNNKVLSHIEAYADHFKLTVHIRFNIEVISIVKSESYEHDGSWNILTRDRTTKIHNPLQRFDAVMICCGQFHSPTSPEYPGQDEFKGQIIHTKDLKDPNQLRDRKNVIVVGVRYSAVDAACEISRADNAVYLSTRRGGWVISRLASGGPIDMVLITRFMNALAHNFPSLHKRLYHGEIQRRFDHDKFGLTPDYPAAAGYPAINDEFQIKVANGSIILKPAIKRLYANSAQFADDSKLENIDTIVMGTGFRTEFPFLQRELFDIEEATVQLYEGVFPPHLKLATMAVLGLVRTAQPLIPPSELQARWAVRVFKGLCKLPSEESMRTQIREHRQRMDRAFIKPRKPEYTVDMITYLDGLADKVGCKPNLWLRLLTDPRLGWALLTGPHLNYEYRLCGPHSWPGARKAILEAPSRTFASFPNRPLRQGGLPSRAAVFTYGVFVAIFVAVLVLILQ